MAKVKLALIAKLEAKPGKETEVENFLKGALPLVEDEPGTIAWFAQGANCLSESFRLRFPFLVLPPISR